MKFEKTYLHYLNELNTAGDGGVFGDHGDDGYGDPDDTRPIDPSKIVIGSKKKTKKKKKKKIKSVGENGRIAYTKGPVQTRAKVERVFGLA
jgi:hypothetical protein